MVQDFGWPYDTAAKAKAGFAEAPMPALLFGASGRVTWANARAAALLGAGAEGLVGVAGGTLFRERLRPGEPELPAHGRAVAARRLDGGTVPVTLARRALPGGAVLVVLTPVRATGSLLSRLVRENERLRTVLETATDGVHILDLQGNVIDCSASFAGMLGHSPAAARRLHVTDWDAHIPADEVPARIAALCERAATFETVHRRRDGTTYAAEVHAKGVVMDGRTVLYASVRDISARKQAQEEALELARAQRQIFERNRSVQLLIDPETGRIERANPAAARFYGWPVETLQQMHITDINCLSADAVRQEMAAAAAEDRLYFNFRHRIADGEVRDVEVYSGPMVVRGRRLLYSIVHDVTARRRQEAALRAERRQLHETKATLEAVVRSTTVGIAWAEADGTLAYVNPRFVDLFGYGVADAPSVEALWARLVPDAARRRAFLDSLRAGQAGLDERRTEQVRVTTAAGQDAHVLVNRSKTAAGVVVLIFTDISAQVEQLEHIQDLALHDELTGLANRSLLSDRLQQAMAESEPGHGLSLAFLDLDGFKAINDAHGHEVGDHVLKAIAQRLRSASRRTDVVARLGGDEFAVLFAGLSGPDESTGLVRRLLEAVAMPIPYQGDALRVSASIGVSHHPQASPVDGDQLLRQADQAMYQAKVGGKNQVRRFDEAASAATERHVRALCELERALDRDELRLHYQPKVDMRAGRVVGLEALIRWQHPQRGLLLPGRFLDVAAGTPLAVRMGRWVLRRALGDMAAWAAQGIPLPISVNVDAHELLEPGFVDDLQAALRAHPAVPAGRLELEILETGALDDLARTDRVMERLRALGVRFALDDFGTGYSSLSYLKNLRADTLKIDRSFVATMLDDHEDLSIVEGALGLARAFRRRVVAEGVESIAHGEVLLDLGCDVAQGYAIARPMPADAVGPWVQGFVCPAAWRGRRRMPEEHLPTVHARVVHRQWVHALQEWCADPARPLPSLDPEACRFSDWLRAERARRPDRAPSLRHIEALHEQVHAQGEELVLHARRTGGDPGPVARLAALRDELLHCLDGYVAEGAR